MGKALDWIKTVALVWDRNECLLWPFSLTKKGYGQINQKGVVTRAHRLVCRLAHGEPPEGDYDAAHSCANRPCCNPGHLSWKTPRENSADMVEHGHSTQGEKQPTSKLTEDDVKAILTSREPNYILAAHYAVVPAAISLIRNKHRWQHVQI